MSALNFPPCPVTWQDIYGEKMPDLPEDMEYCGWGMVKVGQSYKLPPTAGTTFHTPHTEDALPSGPRLLVRRKKVKRIVFTQVGVRVPNRGEWYELQGAFYEVHFDANTSCSPRPVFTRTEEEV